MSKCQVLLDTSFGTKSGTSIPSFNYSTLAGSGEVGSWSIACALEGLGWAHGGQLIALVTA